MPLTHTPIPADLKLLTLRFIPLFLLSTGLLALLSPTTMATLFGMPIESSTFAAGFVQCMGGRNFTFGIIASMLLVRREYKSVARMAGCLAVDGAVDGFVTLKYAGWVAAAPHFGAAVLVPFLSGWMVSE